MHKSPRGRQSIVQRTKSIQNRHTTSRPLSTTKPSLKRSQKNALKRTALPQRNVTTISSPKSLFSNVYNPISQNHSLTQTAFSSFSRPQMPSISLSSLYKQYHSSPYTMDQDIDATGRPRHRATTILCVRKGNKCVMIGDGQVSLGPTVVKPNARKIRRIGNGKVVVGFAGTTADAFALLDILDSKLEQYPGQLLRASIETAKGWRTDKMTRNLEAMLIASDETTSLCISGNGDVIESHDGLLSIGSGSMYALSAARALMDIPEIDATTIAKKSMKIAADICVYTNHNVLIDEIDINNNNIVSPLSQTAPITPPTTSPSSSSSSSSSSTTATPNKDNNTEHPSILTQNNSPIPGPKACNLLFEFGEHSSSSVTFH